MSRQGAPVCNASVESEKGMMKRGADSAFAANSFSGFLLRKHHSIDSLEVLRNFYR